MCENTLLLLFTAVRKCLITTKQFSLLGLTRDCQVCYSEKVFHGKTRQFTFSYKYIIQSCNTEESNIEVF